MKLVRSGKSDFLQKIALDPHLWEQEPQEDAVAAEEFETAKENDPIEMIDRIISRIQTSKQGGVGKELANIEENLLALKGMIGPEAPPTEVSIPEERIPF